MKEPSVIKYRTLVESWAAETDTETANAQLDRLTELAGVVREAPEGRRVVLELMASPVAGERLLAASTALTFAPETAVECLENLAAGRGTIALSARWTLRGYRRGSIPFS